ncbi:unnamed protein product, partial [Mesorhabditis belari]|uniref:Uncharacterized protein n=1 Tax=Mesorhabditis belari TaxID=2138241 RepID=A0AAF3EYK8_9BILA
MEFVSACFRFWCTKDPTPPEKKTKDEICTIQPSTSTQSQPSPSIPVSARVQHSPNNSNQGTLSRPSQGRRRAQSLSQGTKPGKGIDPEERDAINEARNNFTVRSVTQFMKSRGDIYGGDFGRVKITKAQLQGNH